jgi:site-specific DNA recombinase
MAAEPGPDFRWGMVLRRSRLNRDGTEGSTARQERAIMEYLRAHNRGRVVAVYTDIASAYSEKDKREDFNNALIDVKAGRVDGLIGWKVDRLLRRRSQARKLLTLMEECGSRLATVVEGIDTADPAKKPLTEIVLAIYAGSAEDESESTGERIRLMHLDRARKGLVQPSSVRPFGHTEDWFGLVPEEVKILHEVGVRLLQGEASFSIAADLTKRRILTTRGKTNWNSNVLRRMLLSPRMVGKREYGGQLYDLEGVPPIFDMETWEKVCAVLAKRTARSGPVEVHLASGIALCEVCGRTVATNTPGRGMQFTYVCRPRFEGDEACRKISVVGPLTDARIEEEVIAFLADKDRVKALLRQHASGPEPDAIHQRINELSESLLALAQALNPPPGVPRMPLPDYYEQAAIIEKERQELHRRLAVTREASLLTEVLDMEDVAKEWTQRPLAWKRSILKLVTKGIVIESRGKASVQPGRNAFDPTRVRVEFLA